MGARRLAFFDSEALRRAAGEATDIPVSKVRRVLKIAQQPISLETPIGEEEDSHLRDFKRSLGTG